jgi:hypothetical protein
MEQIRTEEINLSIQYNGNKKTIRTSEVVVMM